jgi:hypothetical protein
VLRDAHYDALPDDQKALWSRTRKGPDGGSEWTRRADLAPESPTPAPAADAPASVTPDGMLRIGSGENAYELSPADIKSLMAEKAARDLRVANTPASPAAYKAEISKDTVLPDGYQIQFDEQDPGLADLRNLAHSRGWSQDDFSAALGVYASK